MFPCQSLEEAIRIKLQALDRVPRLSEWLSASEAAHAYGVKVRTVFHWAQDGRLPAIRISGERRRYAPPHALD